ncbi:MAG: LLM class flavin-dependent oxidoreductase [Chloroflexi bacterium]|nr:LLM class flavin-dependent oxidoreductase [Chloroflexota bacterium]
MVVATSEWVTHPWVDVGGRRPRFGIHGGASADWPRLLDFVGRSESLGFDAYWMHDHPARNPGCWTTLAGLAAVTRTIRLGTLVNCVLYRSAVEVARQAADVDRMSDGRAILGLGAGDHEEECRQLGITMPPARERVRLLGEMVQSVKSLWGEPNSARSQALSPGPVQSPRIPILIAGVGRNTLRHVADYGDAVSIPPTLSAGEALRGVPVGPITATDVEQKLAILDTFCDEVFRARGSLVRSHMAPIVLAETPDRLADKLSALPEHRRIHLQVAITGTPEQVVPAYESLLIRGVDYFIAGVLGDDTETLDLLADRVRPALEQRAAAIAG